MAGTERMLPNDLDIFSPDIVTQCECIQYFANSSPTPCDCAASFSWCGKIRSSPPPWMSNASPRYVRAIAEHSICQPGRPGPHGEDQNGSPGFAAFHMVKSAESRLPP